MSDGEESASDNLDSDTESEEGEENSPVDVMSRIDDEVGSPGILERFMESIEDDLSDETSLTRNIIGQVKRMVLRGGLAFLMTTLFVIFISVVAMLFGYPQEIIRDVIVGIYTAVTPLLFASMMTDWMPTAGP